MNFHFILVEPQVSENIGASARAINTMGFSSLRLVKPNGHLELKAKMLAHGSNHILERAELYDDFESSIADLDFVVASTAKKRSVKQDYLDCNDLPNFISAKGNTIKNIGIVFGREESGLTNEELERCDITTSIPLANPYPSLNLSQAVMLYAYTLSTFNIQKQEITETEVKEAEFITLKRKVVELLNKIEISKNKTITTRIMERLALLKEEDIHLLLSVISKI